MPQTTLWSMKYFYKNQTIRFNKRKKLRWMRLLNKLIPKWKVIPHIVFSLSSGRSWFVKHILYILNILTDAGNAGINELIAADWCIVYAEGETNDSTNLSGDKESMETAPIDYCEISKTSILYSCGGVEPPIHEQAADEIAETFALNQSVNEIVQPECLPDNIDSFAPDQIDQLAESDSIVEIIEDGDEVDNIAAVENESGIVDLSIANTDANDLTDEHDVESKLDEHSQSANTSEGFNSCISRESNEVSIVYEPASIHNTENRQAKYNSQAENKTVLKKMEESFVTKTDEIERLNSSVDSRQVKSDDVPISIDTAGDVKVVHTANIDHRKDIALVKTSVVIQNIDPVHVQSEKISPTSSKGHENVTEPKTPRRKQLVAQSIPVQMSPRTPRQRQIPARFLESTYSTPSTRTPRSSKMSSTATKSSQKLLNKKETNLPIDKADKTASKSFYFKSIHFYTFIVNRFVIFSLLRRSFT